MAKVHVWLPDSGHIGHTAITVGNVYISFWPDGQAGKKDIKVKTSQPGLFIQNLQEDVINEGNRLPTTIDLPNLDEDKILDYIADIQGKIPRYQIARNNCSHIVAMALIQGAQKKPSFVPHAGRYNRLGKILGRGIWTPDQVLRFANEIKNA